jgi:hypothetical protein
MMQTKRYNRLPDILAIHVDMASSDAAKTFWNTQQSVCITILAHIDYCKVLHFSTLPNNRLNCIIRAVLFRLFEITIQNCADMAMNVDGHFASIRMKND